MHTRVLSFMYYRYLGTRVTHADSATARGSGPFNSRSSSVERIGWRSAIETWMACRIREWKRMRSRRSRRSHRYQSQALKAALKRPASARREKVTPMRLVIYASAAIYEAFRGLSRCPCCRPTNAEWRISNFFSFVYFCPPSSPFFLFFSFFLEESYVGRFFRWKNFVFL